MIHCFYHSADLDGHCSGAIIKYRFPEAVMHPINYGDAFPWEEIKEDDEVYMVDFALQPFGGMVRLAEIPRKLVWIDHHKSAIDEFKKLIDDFEETKEATYNYNTEDKDINRFKVFTHTAKAACELTWEYLFPDRQVPLAVKLLSLYDSWTYQGHELEDMVLPFQMRMRMEELDPKIGKDAMITWIGLFAGESGEMWTRDLSDEGYILLRYDERQKARYVKTYGFETILVVEDSPHTTVPSMYNCLAVNLGHTNSKVFDSVWRRECPECKGSGRTDNHVTGEVECSSCEGTGYIEPYDLMITFVCRTNKLWNVSLYSTKPEIDCGEIAKSFGGGGHKGAAGFQCKELPFEI